jgi:hypothetical protein
MNVCEKECMSQEANLRRKKGEEQLREKRLEGK